MAENKMENGWVKKVKKVEKFKAERDKVLLTFDLEKIKRFYKKYRDLLIFPYLPPDDIIYRDSMKDILLMDKATPEQKEKAQALLDDYRRVNHGR